MSASRRRRSLKRRGGPAARPARAARRPVDSARMSDRGDSATRRLGSNDRLGGSARVDNGWRQRPGGSEPTRSLGDSARMRGSAASRLGWADSDERSRRVSEARLELLTSSQRFGNSDIRGIPAPGSLRRRGIAPATASVSESGPRPPTGGRRPRPDPPPRRLGRPGARAVPRPSRHSDGGRPRVLAGACAILRLWTVWALKRSGYWCSARCPVLASMHRLRRLGDCARR